MLSLLVVVVRRRRGMSQQLRGGSHQRPQTERGKRRDAVHGDGSSEDGCYARDIPSSRTSSTSLVVLLLLLLLLVVVSAIVGLIASTGVVGSRGARRARTTVAKEQGHPLGFRRATHLSSSSPTTRPDAMRTAAKSTAA